MFLLSFVKAASSAALTEPFLEQNVPLMMNYSRSFNLLVCVQDVKSSVHVSDSNHLVLDLSPRELLVTVPAMLDHPMLRGGLDCCACTQSLSIECVSNIFYMEKKVDIYFFQLTHLPH